ncbi:hypothetical protein J2129_000436 [Methanofollis sp. W23]|nr:hypothetical protein [Methanofollis sp. W23]
MEWPAPPQNFSHHLASEGCTTPQTLPARLVGNGNTIFKFRPCRNPQDSFLWPGAAN